MITLVAVVGAVAYYQFGGGDEVAQGRQKRASPVNVVAPARAEVQDRVAAVGTLQSREAVALTSEVNGRVVAINFAPGDRVERGQLLVQMDDRQARVELRVAEAQYADARRQFERASTLRSNNSISQAQVDALQTTLDVAEAQRDAARTRLDDHRIEAPFAGSVGLVDLSIGAYVNIGDTIATLDATDPMELAFSVPERYLGQISLGQRLNARTAAFPDRVFEGSLAELGTRLDELSRSLPVRAVIANPDNRLRPGQFMSVSLTLQERQALVVPEQAVLVQGAKAFVFVADQDQARRIEVTLGAREPGMVEVVTGLDASDSVIVTGQDRLSSGDRITVVQDDGALLSSDQSLTRPWQ
ncbi:efflux RND transporter periplasmic adaptor subunit [Marinobacter sp.]|uniref:efflux RND transporter periplasmic adaptor subunit n=1 Tax=Marinobacter sp. TaxID=50741 RepID=UPI00299F005E|nr:efflux RND transporter periplasmic adaptor subunit [Marinobacter sp.]